jgi:translation initiation factor 2 beta subunit (eIF-2beta)/eIF-5
MSKKIPIRDSDDPFDRYTMPDLEYRNKHQGQYHTTVISYLSKIAKALHAPIDLIVKFFGLKLSTRSVYVTMNQELQLKGSFDYDILMRTLRLFIKEYILCKHCGLPELQLCNKRVLYMKCGACGHKDACDMSDRIYKVWKDTLPLVTCAKNVSNVDVVTEEVAHIEDTDEWQVDISPEAINERRTIMEGNSKVMKYLIQK